MSLLLLDLDNTLVDRDLTFAGWARDLLAACEQPPSKLGWLVEADRHGVEPREGFLAGVKEELDLADSLPDLVEAWAVDFPRRYRCEIAVLDQLTEARAQGWALGIVTNGDTRVQAAKIAAASLDDVVDVVCISAAEGVWKPDPALFALAAERTGTSLNNGWMVGDDPVADILGGLNAGLRTVWLARGRTWPAIDHRRDAVAATPTEAMSIALGQPNCPHWMCRRRAHHSGGYRGDLK